VSFFKACDLRGIVGEDFDTADVMPIGRALGDMLTSRGDSEICVGGDFRRSTPEIRANLVKGLLHAGVTVLDLGQVPTPVVYFASRHLPCPNAAIVTASHNPGRYNGIKFQIAGQPATSQLVSELQERVSAPLEPTGSGKVETTQIVGDYEDWVVREARQLVHSAPADQLQSRHGSGDTDSLRPLRIVVDAMCGACTEFAPRVLASLGHEVVSVNETIDPDFSGGAPNPSDESKLQALMDAVVDQRADIGIALDGDGDRVITVDHTGAIVRPEQMAVLLIQRCFSQPTVVYDLKCASIVAKAIRSAEGHAKMQKSGYGFIKSAMIEHHAEIGVEASGHHFFGRLAGGDDGLFTALVILEVLQQVGMTLADLTAPIGWPAITPDLRVPFLGDAAAAIASIEKSCGGTISHLDGVRAEYNDGWGLARASITESAITLRFEARERSQLPELASQFLSGVPELCSQVLEMIQ
jgi:phosphomannomutase / phosphoglucomutase